MAKGLLTLLFVVALLVGSTLVSVRADRDDEDNRRNRIDWEKVLNNLISASLHNVRIDGQFLANYPFPDLLRLPEKDTCNRESALRLADLRKPESFRGALKRVYDSGTLRIGVTSLVANSPPYFNNTATPPSGFFYDLGNIVANELAFFLLKPISAQFIVIPATGGFFPSIKAALDAGTVDTVVGVSYLTSRILAVDFTCWYESPSPFAVYSAAGSNIGNITGLSGFNTPSIRVATLTGSIFATAVATYLPRATVVPFTNLNVMFDNVGVTADITFSIVGETIGYNNLNNNRLTEAPFTRTLFGGGNAFATKRNL